MSFDKAWSGLKAVSFGSVPTVPMKLEQAISTAYPEHEVAIDSFEDYGTALAHCEDAKDVGLLFVLENCGSLPTSDVVRNLSRAYGSATGWPAFTVLLSDSAQTLNGHQILRSSPHILEYLPIDSILNPAQCRITLERLWGQYTEAFQEFLIPVPLQRTLSALGEENGLSAREQAFESRVVTILTHNLNISWFEFVGLKWASVIAALDGHSKVIASLKGLDAISRVVRSTGQHSSILQATKASGTLGQRIHAVSVAIRASAVNGNLAEELKAFGTHGGPGTPALNRQIVRCRDKLVAASLEEFETSSEPKAG